MEATRVQVGKTRGYRLTRFDFLARSTILDLSNILFFALIIVTKQESRFLQDNNQLLRNGKNKNQFLIPKSILVNEFSKTRYIHLIMRLFAL